VTCDKCGCAYLFEGSCLNCPWRFEFWLSEYGYQWLMGLDQRLSKHEPRVQLVRVRWNEGKGWAGMMNIDDCRWSLGVARDMESKIGRSTVYALS